jgi:hypothetical protein
MEHQPQQSDASTDTDGFMCRHKRFGTDVTIRRWNDGEGFMADVKIACADCGLPFSFKGLTVGINDHGAAISADGTEARLAIIPGLGGSCVPVE